MTTNSTRKTDTIAFACLFVFFGILYLVTLCRTVYMGDSGEITTAIFTGGIIHPPGYPLFGLLGRIALVLIPFGEPAFRVGCLVALAGAGAVAMLYRFCREAEVSLVASIAAAATFGGSYAFWSQCVRVEVYSLHALLCGIALWAALRYGKTGASKPLFLSAVAFSLGLAHQPTIVLLLPALLLLAGGRLWTEPKAPLRVGSIIATILIVGPSFWLLLMYWARQNPLMNWSRPVTFDALFRHITARIYAGNLRIPESEKMLSRLNDAGSEAVQTLLWIGIPLALLGIVLLAKREPRLLAGLLVGAIPVIIYCQFYIINDILVYYIPVWWILFVFVAVALDQAFTAFRSPVVRTRLVPVCCLLLPIAQISRNFEACNLSQATFVRDFARQKLEHVAPKGILVLRSDNDINPVDYMRFVIGVRQDVTVIESSPFTGMFVFHDIDPSNWYLYSLRSRGIDIPTTLPPSTGNPQKDADTAFIALLERLSRSRPLHTTFLDDRTAEQRKKDEITGRDTTSLLMRWFKTACEPTPQGIVIRLYRPHEHFTLKDLIATNKKLWEETSLPDLSHQKFQGEMDQTYFTDHYAVMMLQYGYLYELNKDPSEAASIYSAANQFAPDNATVRKKWADFTKQYRLVSQSSTP